MAGVSPTPVAAEERADVASEENFATNDLAQGPVGRTDRRLLQVLYLFSGPKRKSGLAKSLRRARKGTNVKFNIKEVDIIRGGRKHDMLIKTKRERIMKSVREGAWDMIAASPPRNTFSRARGQTARAPHP